MERASFISGLDGFAANVPAAERRQKRPFNLYPFDLDRHSNDKKVQFILTIRATKGEWILLRITHKPSCEEKTDVFFLFPVLFLPFCQTLPETKESRSCHKDVQELSLFKKKEEDL